MTRLARAVALCAALLLAGCESREEDAPPEATPAPPAAEALPGAEEMESYITALEQLTRTLSGVDDAEAAEAARDEVLKSMDEMREILEALGTASEELKNAYGVRYLDAALKYQDQKRRIEADPDLGAVLSAPLADLPGPQ